MQFIDLKAQYTFLQEKIDKRIRVVLDHGHYIMGPEVAELEERLADFVGVKHAVTCANGTDALTLAMMTLGVKEGDAVFCPTFTFFASAEVIAFSGAEPVFVDSDVDTFNICCSDLEDKIKAILSEGRLTPRAIIAVDLFGLPANYSVIQELAKKYNLKIIEDAAQGFGGSLHGKRAGSFGDLATTSFFPAKPLGCYGDGGAVFTNSDEYSELLKSYRIHGKGTDKYDNVRIGVNSRLDTIQATILLEKLVAFPNELMLRNDVASQYEKLLDDRFLKPSVPSGQESSWAQYSVRHSKRDDCVNMLAENGVPSAVYYKKCMHQQTAFSGNSRNDRFPVAEEISRTVLSLPMHPYLSFEDIQRVSSVLNSVGTC